MPLYLLRADLQVEVLGEDAAVVDLQSNDLFRLNGVAVLLAQHLAQPCSPESLVEAVVEEFDVDPAIARQDVLVFLEELRELGWLTDVP